MLLWAYILIFSLFYGLSCDAYYHVQAKRNPESSPTTPEHEPPNSGRQAREPENLIPRLNPKA